MSLDDNKKIATDLFDRIAAGDVAGVLDLLTDDATWWILGNPEHLPVAGLHRKDQIARVFHNMLGRLKDGLKMTVHSALAEGDQVALEAESHGDLKNGRVYDQRYHFRITVRDGKISAVREYLDTQHAYAVWFQPDAPA